MDVAREYVRLGLRFNRLEDGLVDCYIGDPRLRAEVLAEPTPEPAALAARARALLAELPDAGLGEERATYLDGQLTALECAGRRMAGAALSYLDEVHAYLQVRPVLADPDEYAEVHRDLAALLPGRGGLTARYAAHRNGDRCPPHLLPNAVEALSRALRTAVLTDVLPDSAPDVPPDLAPDTDGGHARSTGSTGNSAKGGLPAGERVEYALVTDKPWSGFNYYFGNYRSKVAINADLPHRLVHLPNLVAHEAYPGHHTENCRKQRNLVERGNRVEHSIHLVNTPECLLTEGLADLGLYAAVGPGWGRWTQEVLRDGGVDTGDFDGELAERVADVAVGLDRVRQDAAIMLHDLGRDEDEVVAYLCRWLLIPEPRARESLRFVADPLWRAYTSTYVEGRRLLMAWLEARPAGEPLARRFARLLDEPLTPARIVADTPAAAGMT